MFFIFFHSKEKNENSNVLLFCNSLQLQLIDRIVEQLEKVGLTEYEAKIYLSLLRSRFNSATLLAERSEVPRTKIYTVLESLKRKGRIKIYSCSPLLFKPVDPVKIFEKYRKNYEKLLDSIRSMLER